jgi:hypothetical protein
MTIDDDRNLHPIAHPLGAWEVRVKRAAQRELVGSASCASLRGSVSVCLENPTHEIATEGHAQIALHVCAEVEEGTLPTSPGVEDGLNV